MPDLIKLSVQMRINTEKKGDWFIATCPLLNVVSQGQSASQAVERNKEEILALIDFCVHHGILHEMLQHRFPSAGAEQEEGQFAHVEEFKEFQWVAFDFPVEVINELTHAA